MSFTKKEAHCGHCGVEDEEEEEVTARLDKLAAELETVEPRLALALDLISDRLEGRMSA